jgi:hypothetical protein
MDSERRCLFLSGRAEMGHKVTGTEVKVRFIE